MEPSCEIILLTSAGPLQHTVLRRATPVSTGGRRYEERTVITQGGMKPPRRIVNMEPAGPSYKAMVERYRRIASLRRERVTLQDIANQEGISRERVRQILAGGLPKPSGRPPVFGESA